METSTAKRLEEQYKEELSAAENEWKPLLEELQKALGKKPDKPGVPDARAKVNEMLLTTRNGEYDAKRTVNEKYKALVEMEIEQLEWECDEKCDAITEPVKEPYTAKIRKLEELRDKYWPHRSSNYGGYGI